MRCDLFFSPSDGKEFTSRFDVYLVTVEIAFTPMERIIVFFFTFSLFFLFYSNSLEIPRNQRVPIDCPPLRKIDALH